MKTTRSRKPKWPKQITLGNVTVTIYKRITPNGKTGFMLAYKQDGKRKFDSYPDEAEAIQEANTKARQLSTLGVNLAAWLAAYAGRKGKVWTGGHDEFYDAQQETAKAAGLKWKANALRHSAASYMFALSNDAGRVAGFLGNSASVVHKHYRELVRPVDAQRWFNMKPERPDNVVAMVSEAAN